MPAPTTFRAYPIRSDHRRQESPIYIHVFLFRWNPDVTQAQIERASAEIQALQGQIPDLLETQAGANESAQGKGHAFGGVMRFTNRAAFQAYVSHPVHQKLVSWLMPLIEPIELDFEA